MFWAKEEEENSLMQLLKSNNFTLEDVLLNEFVVQESRYGKAELVNYITREENMVALLNHSLNPVIDQSIPPKQQYRLSFIASEILTIRGTDVYQSIIVSNDVTKKVLADFIKDTAPMSHLIAGFFAKIVECLLSRQFALTFDILQSTPFFDKCLRNINLGAIECLLENLVRIPNNLEGTNIVKQWMIDENFFEKLIDRMVESPNDDDKECLAEVFSEIIRELRDKLYMVENKEDALHDKVMDVALVTRIADNLVLDESCTNEELRKRSSLINSSAKILETYIKTNFVPHAPAQHLDEVEKNLLEERHYSYGMNRNCLDNESFDRSYQPDPERIVEGVVANRADNILQTVLRDVQAGGSVWQPLLRLLVEVCNTNYHSTHEALATGMRKLPFIKLIDAGKKLPRATVLHSLIVKIVSLLLHSRFNHCEVTISPAAEFLLTDGGLIKNVFETACTFHPPTDLISSSGLRSFNQNLGDAVLRAKRSTLATTTLKNLLNGDDTWPELEDIITNYNAKHRPRVTHDYNDSSMFTSTRNDSSHGFNDSEEWQDASTKFAELDASSSARSFGSFDSNNFFAGPAFGGSGLPNLQRFSDLEEQYDTPDEDEFKKLCSERANSSSCSGGKSSFDDSDLKWPGDVKKQDEPSVMPSTYPEQCLENEIEEIESDEWVWPTAPPLGETECVTKTGPRPENIWVDETEPDMSYLDRPPPPASAADDMWADFSSFPTTNPTSSSASTSASLSWPGAESPEQGESSDWPLNNSHDSKPSDPATVGLAVSISHPDEEQNCSQA